MSAQRYYASYADVTRRDYSLLRDYCTKLCTNSAAVSPWSLRLGSCTLPARVHSPYGPVSSGANGAQRRVSQWDFPRRFLHLEPVEARSGGGGLVLRRLHGPLSASRLPSQRCRTLNLPGEV